MSFAFARSRYRQAEKFAPEGAVEPYDVVHTTLKELTRSLNVLAAAQTHERPMPSEHVNRALTAIYILQSSLDFELAEEIATDLFQLYEFARYHVIKAWGGEPEARVAEAAGALNDILQAWDAIGTQVKSTKA